MPVSGLFAVLFPPTVVGWQTSERRYGLPIQSTTFAAVNGWLYYSPGTTDWDASLALEPVAERTLSTHAWREEIGRWYGTERPVVFQENAALQAEPIETYGDAELADHIARAAAHFARVAPLHFDHNGFELAAGMLLRSTAEWGIDDTDVVSLLAGASPATSAVRSHLVAIAQALTRAPTSIDEVRAEAGDALDALTREHGWRVLDGNDLAGPTFGERPDLLLAAIRGEMRDRSTPVGTDPGSVRARLSGPTRDRFDELLAEARELYSLNDDDNGVCFVWPLGLIRRGVLEAGTRLVVGGRLHAIDDLFEATPDEIDALLHGDGPTADELAGRHSLRLTARDLDPPSQLGTFEPEDGGPLPPHVAELVAIRDAYFAACRNRSTGAMHGVGVGRQVARGPARLLAHGTDDAIDDIRPGDVLIAVTTTCNLNPVFPILAGVATEEGGLFSHTAVLARELGVPAVVGAPGLLAAITNGDLVEIDPVAGVVRVIERA